MNKKALLEALKELARLVVFALPGVLIQIFTDNPERALGYGTAILTVLRGLDKYIHENPKINARGLIF